MERMLAKEQCAAASKQARNKSARTTSSAVSKAASSKEHLNQSHDALMEIPSIEWPASTFDEDELLPSSMLMKSKKVEVLSATSKKRGRKQSSYHPSGTVRTNA